MTALPEADCFLHPDAVAGVVTGDDWRRPELQARYGGHWVPALLARIRAQDSSDGGS
ncbi:hypothetical protein [Dactylosporangium sp. NPDC049140]|uniref:hypothetical protein n=1 Tax=Dactylosporangium sp. NPDC049140 TaxID=3155647 RepID=UPI0033D92577